ncbi:CdaR family transcriptional regulator [Cytobacillus sp. NCCP-133]|uniref:CdaR family transcriptional regulator n=1 Tax=Cytobacillus sp. NCCP-133 TaxID=766848 RepID=UPI002230504C|nr:sugar diacid recognition domain-containing protein [Cytobacillus sp. NCCP-133]GLB61835.1 CdaR family transcriptional regulator [Cytobacillus sp. NCCP-133]
MKILENIAQDIVEKTSEIIQYPISITDNEGYIIGSTDPGRIGIFHRPSLEVIRKNNMVYCKNEMDKKILPGVSAPLKFNNKVIGVLGIVGNPADVEKYVHLVKNHVEMMCQDAFRKEMVELKEKMVEMLVHQLIHYKESEQEEKDHIFQYAKLLEFDLLTDRVCLIIDITNTSSGDWNLFGNLSFHFQKEVLSFLKLLFQKNDNDIVSFLDFKRFIIFKSMPFPESLPSLLDKLDEKLAKINSFLEAKYSVSAKMGVGDVQNGISGYSDSYQNAMKAIKIGLGFKGQPDIHLYNEREALLNLLPSELAPDYKQKLLKLISPLTEQDNYEVLSSTFLGFCKYNMNLSEASRNMFIHRNTIIYRLEKISEITSLNTSSFEDCMLLYTSIQCYEDMKS